MVAGRALLGASVTYAAGPCSSNEASGTTTGSTDAAGAGPEPRTASDLRPHWSKWACTQMFTKQPQCRPVTIRPHLLIPGTMRPRWSTTPQAPAASVPQDPNRSEEHTSELQSRENLVCRLLLETKKNNHKSQEAH